MGLISTPTIITTAVSRTTLIDEKPNLLRDAIIGAVLTDQSVSNSIILEILTGYSTKVEAYHRYGLNTYIRDLPSSNAYSTGRNDQAIIDYLEELHGEPIVILEIRKGDSTPFYQARVFLQDNRAWDSLTNIVHNPPNIRFRHPTKPVTWSSHNVSRVSDSQLRLVYRYYDDNNLLRFHIQNEYYPRPPGGDAYQNEYYLASDPEQRPIYWNYYVSSGLIPELTPDRPLSNTQFPYYPIAILRHNKRYIDVDKTTDEYKTTKRLLDYINVDADEIIELIKENPDRNIIDDVFVLFSLDIQSKEQYSIQYFFGYFLKLSKILNVSIGQWDHYFQHRGYDIPINYVTIEEGSYGGYDITVGYNYILVSENLIGVLDEPYTSETIVRGRHDKFPQVSGLDSWFEMSEINFRMRTSANTYTQIKVHGLYTIHDVHREAPVVCNLANSLDQEGAMSIPLEYTILHQEYNQFDRSLITLEALNISVYAIRRDEVKWYETNTFRSLVTLAVYAVIVFTAQVELLPALAGLGVYQALGILLTQIALSIAIKYAFSFLIEAVGVDNAFLVALAAIAISIAGGAFGGGAFQLASAEQLMYLSTLLIQSINTRLAEDIEEIQDDYSDFLVEKEEKLERLEEAEDSLFEGIDLLVLTRNKPYFNPNETYDEFFERTIGETNPGVLSLDMIENHVDSLLVLPDTANVLNESGDFGYGLT